MQVLSSRRRKEVLFQMSKEYMTNSEITKMERTIINQNKDLRSKEIAKKMKSLNMFSNSFICEITGVSETYLKKCKPIAEV